MAEGESPQTVDGAVRGFIGLFILAAVLHGADIWNREPLLNSIIWWATAVMLAIFDFKWVSIKKAMGPRFSATAMQTATDFRWWAATLLLILIFSPFVEQRRWPFSSWFETVLPIIDQSPESKATSQVGTDRIIDDASPADLMHLYRDNLSTQADKLFASHVGKWMRIDGSISNISGPSPWFISFTIPDGIKIIFMYFDDSWGERLSVLSRKQNISVIGQIRDASATDVHLKHCELLLSKK